MWQQIQSVFANPDVRKLLLAAAITLVEYLVAGHDRAKDLRSPHQDEPHKDRWS